MKVKKKRQYFIIYRYLIKMSELNSTYYYNKKSEATIRPKDIK